VYCDVALDLQKRRRVDQFLGLWVDGVGGVGVRDGGDRSLVLLLLLGFLLGVKEPHFALEHGAVGPVVWRTLLELLLGLLILLLVGRFDDTIASSPGHAGAEPHTHPLLDRLPRPLHNDVDVVQAFSLACNQSARVGLLEGRVLEHGQPYPGGPLD
jgi:hypothetical protein